MAFNEKTNMYVGYIYVVINKLNGMKYVGQTRRTVEARWKNHLAVLKSDINYFHNSILKYGEQNFSISEVDRFEAENIALLTKKLNELEIYYISKYDTLCPNGYNLTKGWGNNSINCDKPVDQYDKYGNFIRSYNSASEAACATQGSRKGITNCCNRTVDKRNKRTYSSGGFIWRFKGDTDIEDSLNNSLQRPVIQYDLNGNIIHYYDSIQSASTATGILPESIGKCCKGQSKQSNGYVFLYHNQNFSHLSYNNVRPVNCYDLDDNFIKTFVSIREASMSVGKSESGVADCCKKEQKTCGGYKWFYADDPNQPNKTKIMKKDVA